MSRIVVTVVMDVGLSFPAMKCVCLGKYRHLPNASSNNYTYSYESKAVVDQNRKLMATSFSTFEANFFLFMYTLYRSGTIDFRTMVEDEDEECVSNEDIRLLPIPEKSENEACYCHYMRGEEARNNSNKIHAIYDSRCKFFSAERTRLYSLNVLFTSLAIKSLK